MCLKNTPIWKFYFSRKCLGCLIRQTQHDFLLRWNIFCTLNFTNAMSEEMQLVNLANEVLDDVMNFAY